jgi:hypothetical protein
MGNLKYLNLDRIWSYLIATLGAFFEPISVLIGWMLIFIISDMITGIYASYCKGQKITSHKMQRTVIKFLMYGGAIMLLEGFDKYFITFAELSLSKIGATIICGIELYSVFENCYKATGNIVFKVLTQFTKKEVEEKTGVHIDE